MLQALIAGIEEKKAELDRRRPLATEAIGRLRRSFDVELTYTSNAIEGNTLTLRETAEVIERGITVGGKSLRDHLEAVDHYDALQWMRALAAEATPVDESVVCDLHRRIVARSQPDIAGAYSRFPRRIAGSPVVFPNPARIPDLMAAFGAGLGAAPKTPAAAFEVHFRLTAIHPFADGNGRAARILMNLLLLRAGYPPVAVRPQDRRAYLDALEQGSLAGDLAPFQTIMHARLDSTLEDYLGVVREALPGAAPSSA
jgi:Fic family protein